MKISESELDDVVLYVSHLTKFFRINAGLLTGKGGDVRAVDDVSFYLKRGETLGIVGETGCGKTTLGRTILNLTDATDGDVYFRDTSERSTKRMSDFDNILSLEGKLDNFKSNNEDGSKDDEIKEILKELLPLRAKHSLTKMSSRRIKEYRRLMQPVFQDPFGSLDSRKLIKDIIAEPMKLLTDKSGNEILETSRRLISEIGLSEDHLFRFPHEFSGGQRQRIGIARAISIEPKLLVLDEPTSALDVSVQSQILNTLLEMQRKYNLSYIFISHHLSVIRLVSDRVAVMYLGKIIELTETNRLFTDMLHPYTKALLSAIPVPDPNVKIKRIILEGEIPSPSNPPKGCYFHPRCNVAMETCGWSPRDLVGPMTDMLNKDQNPDAKAIPDIKRIVINEMDQEVDIEFEPTANVDQSAVNLVKELVEKESEKNGGVKFRAIKDISISGGNNAIRVSMIQPLTPEFKEVKPGHFVSCLLYEKEKLQTMDVRENDERFGRETETEKTAKVEAH